LSIASKSAMKTHGCKGDAVPLVGERWYDSPEFGGYLGNVGYQQINPAAPIWRYHFDMMSIGIYRDVNGPRAWKAIGDVI
ncbi:MAG: hypothetical protein O7A03_11980, partial [Alphaproteobacteria bacterium]|nr:hypothetical protein [Alphaproteobacteria bacterium]